MMNGYSVQDAASVLGVPEGRVWELLARGVLSGTPEGDSMRVFLKADAPAPARPAPPEELPRSNGNGGSQGGEASAFRELLTEFRNLTERYGQALLALGEARGEVAGLRSRVELLEARIDLRLPARVDAEPVSWAAPSVRELAPEAPAPAPPAPAEVEAVLPTPAPLKRSAHSRKARSTRAAVAGFAEALARAQDPNLAPVGETAAVEALSEEEISMPAPESASFEAVADDEGAEAPFSESAALGVVVEAVVAEEIAPLVEADAEPLPVPEAELAPAEVAASAAPAEVTYRPPEIEPDWFADGDFSWLDAAELEARSQPETVAVEVVPGPAAELTPEIDAASEATAEPEPIAVELAPEPLAAAIGVPPHAEPIVPMEPVAAIVEELAAGLQPAPIAPVEPEPIVVEELAAEWQPAPIAPAEWQPAPIAPVELQPAPIAHVEPEPAAAAGAPGAEMQALPVGGGAEEAVMWLGGQREPADEPEASARSYPGPTLSPRIRDAFEPVAWPAIDRGAAVAQAVAPPPPLAMTEEELAQLARDEGWDDAEVSAIRAMISRPSTETVELPGSAELDEAISALQAVPIAPRSEVAPANQWAKPATRETEPIARDDWAFEVEPPLPQVATPRNPAAPRYDAPDPDWVRRRRGPAASAYRRIRRIFTG